MEAKLHKENERQDRKPLGGRGYGSTPHLLNSRLGEGDYHIHEGQALILTERARDRYDRIIVTEKLDGSCVTVAKKDGFILPVTRAGYLASESPWRIHRMFAEWVEPRKQRFDEILGEGDRVAGEWLAVAHGTKYAFRSVDELFVGFAIIQGRKKRLLHDEVRYRFSRVDVVGAHVISDGPPLSEQQAMELLGPHGRHNALEQVEGAVWVCERKGGVDFLAKHVVQNKVDGKYLSGIGGNDNVDILNEWPGYPSLGVAA